MNEQDRIESNASTEGDASTYDGTSLQAEFGAGVSESTGRNSEPDSTVGETTRGQYVPLQEESTNESSGSLRSSSQQENTKAQVQPQGELTDSEKEEVLANYVKESIAHNVVALNHAKIKRQYPKALKALEAFITERAGQPVEEDTIVGVLLYSPRSVLYEFFDNKKIFINIAGSETDWHYTINGGYANMGYASRVLAECDAFEDAFSQLNRK